MKKLLSVLSILVWLALSVSLVKAQNNGVITGRVVTEDGGGLANVMVRLSTVQGNRSGIGQVTSTDEEGNFRFTGLTPDSYLISFNIYKGYTPAPDDRRREARYYRIGDHATITAIRGGVITGRVANAEGEPVINLPITAFPVRDAAGLPVRGRYSGIPRFTDDRGVYRLYGLPPGKYLVAANGLSTINSQMSFYHGEAPTFHPSSTRETAAEVNVTSGGEASGVDIRYRGELGYAVSGTVIGGPTDITTSRFAIGVNVYNVATGVPIGSTYLRFEAEPKFVIYGLVDGEYEVAASVGGYENSAGFISEPKRFWIRGADVGGIDLRLASLSSISGKVNLEKTASSCEGALKSNLREVVVFAARDEKEKQALPTQFPFSTGEAAVDEKGEFAFPSLNANRYRLEARLPNETWYLKSITESVHFVTRSSNSRGEIQKDVSRAGLLIRPGEKRSDVTLTVADGGASLSGKVVSEREGAALPRRIRVYLVPSEVNAADEVLRYSETLMRTDRTFTLRSVAPGGYWLLPRVIPDDEQLDRPQVRAAWESAERAKLRRDAEAKKIEVELKPCQRISDFVLKY